MKIKKDDQVIITTGKDRGKVGQVERVIIKSNKIVVKGVNLVKKHQKKSSRFPQGGIIEKFAPVNDSILQIICQSCNKPTKIGYLISKDQNKTKVRICRHCQASLDAMKSDK